MWRPVESRWDQLSRTIAASNAPKRRAAPLQAISPCFGCPPVTRSDRRVMSILGVDGFLSTQFGSVGFEPDRPRARSVLATVAGVGLGEMPAEDGPSKTLLRASNLANIMTVGLRMVPEAGRSKALSHATTSEWTQQVLRLAKGIGLGLEDSVRFAMSMYFVIGIIDSDAGKRTLYAEVYRKVVTGYRVAAEDASPLSPEQAQGLLIDVKGPATLKGLGRGLGGLGALGEAQCAQWDLLCHAGKAVGGVAKAAEQAGKDVQKAVEQAFNWTSDVLCKGLKWLLGEQFGGLLCAVFSTYLNFIKYTATSLITVAMELGRMLLEVVKLLMAGKPKEAGLAFLKGVTTIVFLVPPIGPAFAILLGVNMTELSDIARKVADRAPLFIVQVAAAIFGVLAPTPQSIVGVVQALRPAIAVFAGATIAKGFKMVVTQAENAVDSVVSFGCGIVLGVVTVANIASDMASALDKAGGDIIFAAEVKVKQFQMAVERKWKRIMDAFATFNFKEVVLAIADLAGMEEIAGKVLKAADETPAKIGAEIDKLVKGLNPTELIAKLELNQLPEMVEAAAKKLSPEQLAAKLDPAQLAKSFVSGSKKMTTPVKAQAVVELLKALPISERAAFLAAVRAGGV